MNARERVTDAVHWARQPGVKPCVLQQAQKPTFLGKLGAELTIDTSGGVKLAISINGKSREELQRQFDRVDEELAKAGKARSATEQEANLRLEKKTAAQALEKVEQKAAVTRGSSFADLSHTWRQLGNGVSQVRDPDGKLVSQECNAPHEKAGVTEFPEGEGVHRCEHDAPHKSAGLVNISMNGKFVREVCNAPHEEAAHTKDGATVTYGADRNVQWTCVTGCPWDKAAYGAPSRDKKRRTPPVE